MYVHIYHTCAYIIHMYKFLKVMNLSESRGGTWEKLKGGKGKGGGVITIPEKFNCIQKKNCERVLT